MALGAFAGGLGGAVLGRAVVELIADSQKLRGDLAKARKEVGTSTTAMEKRGAAFAKAWQTAGLIAGAAILAFGVSAVRAFKEAQKVTAQTEAVLKSTGGIANVTKTQVQDLAAVVRDYSGIEDEAVQSGANMLLTFTQIRNEVGKGNDIFNQATHSIADLSIGLGKDMVSSALMLGKALNDPTTGMLNLRRAGVQFTKSQQETIKSLVESGKLLEAQKIILAEVSVQFGESAEAAGKTFAGKLNILKSQFGDLQEAVGGFIVGGLSPLVGGFNKLPGPIKGVAAGVIGLTLAMVALAAVVKTVRNAFLQLGLAKAGAGAGFVALAAKAAVLPGILMAVGAGLGSLVRNLTNTVTAEQALISVTGQLEAAVLSGKFTWAEIQGAVDEFNATIGTALPAAQQLSIDSFRNLATGIGELPPELAGAGEAIDDWRQKASVALHGVGDVMTELAGKTNLSADQIVKAFLKQAKAVANFESNMAKLVAAGAPEALVKQLSEMGLQGAAILDAIAKSSKTDMDRVFSAFDKATGGVSIFTGKLNALDGRHVKVFIDTFTGDLPTHARGFHGVVRGAYPFIAGEAGPERVDITPLNQMKRGMASPGNAVLTAASAAAGVQVYAPIIVNGDVVDTDRWQRKVVEALGSQSWKHAGV